MTSEFSKVRSFFQSIQVHLSDIWLESCLTWCKSETLAPGYTLKDLQSKVYEQWLLLDLRDVEVSCLPPNISSHKHFLLNGNFCLQMIQVIDISKPKFWQLQRIRNNQRAAQDSDSVGTGKRMLQLTLTDGVQEVEAMEYKPISSLSINLVPGIKIRIMGPVVVRRGRLMLEPENVKILGGEVDELLVSNAAENVLARILKLPENSNPGKIEERLLLLEDKEDDTRGYQKLSRPQPTMNQPQNEVTPMITDAEAKEIEDLMLEAERSLPIPPPVNYSKTPDLFEDDDFDPGCFDHFASTSTQLPPKKTTSIELAPKKTTFVQLPQQNPTSRFEDDDDVFNDIDIEAHLDQVDQETTIARLHQEKAKGKKGTFKVRAKFKTVVEKLTVGEEEYQLIITVEDRTGDLNVKVHSDLISEFAGYTPAEIQVLKASILCKEGNAVEKVMKAIQKVKDRLVKLDGLMEVTIGNDEIYTVTKIY